MTELTYPLGEHTPMFTHSYAPEVLHVVTDLTGHEPLGLTKDLAEAKRIATLYATNTRKAALVYTAHLSHATGDPTPIPIFPVKQKAELTRVERLRLWLGGARQ